MVVCVCVIVRGSVVTSWLTVVLLAAGLNENCRDESVLVLS